MQATTTFLGKNLIPLLRCIVLCWIVTGCAHDIMDDEMGEEIPRIYPNTRSYSPPYTNSYSSSYSRPNTGSYSDSYSDSYSRPSTSSYSRANTRPNARIENYKKLIQACKDHMVSRDKKALFNIENITYKNLEKEYKKFVRVLHPDRGGDGEKIKLLNRDFEELKERLEEDGCILQDLKGVGEALLRHLETHP